MHVKASDCRRANAEIKYENDSGNPIIKTLVLFMFFLLIFILKIKKYSLRTLNPVALLKIGLVT